MSSAVDIANQALLMLGSLPIISFNDESVEASAVRALYPTAKKQVLRSYPWRCATVSERLALRSEPPLDPNWEYSHAIPENVLRVLNVYPEGCKQQTEWVVAGKNILTRTTPVIGNVIKDIPEPQIDVHVEMALVARIALDLSYTLTASQSREASLYQMFEAKLNEARITDRQEATHQFIPITTLDRVRY
jgi:hypothetical protein